MVKIDKSANISKSKTKNKSVKISGTKKISSKSKAVIKVPTKAKAKTRVITKAKTKATTKRKAVAKNIKITPNQYFYLKNGAILKSVRDLAKVMDELDDEVFFHHVNDEKHDFANWITHVFKDLKLAQQLLEAEKNKETNHYIILKYMIKNDVQGVK